VNFLCLDFFPNVGKQRKSQNRNSQRAFRRRQASYITSLETELEELRANYKTLLQFFNKIKQAVDSVGQEILGKDALCKSLNERRGDSKLDSELGNVI
jgi:hypothetical protein